MATTIPRNTPLFPKPGVASSILAGGIARLRLQSTISGCSSRSAAGAKKLWISLARLLSRCGGSRSGSGPRLRPPRTVTALPEHCTSPLQGGSRRFDPVILHWFESPRSSVGSRIQAPLAPRTLGDTRCQAAPRNATIGHVLVTLEAPHAGVRFGVTPALVTTCEGGGSPWVGAGRARGPPEPLRSLGSRVRDSGPRNDATRGVCPGSVPARKRSVRRAYSHGRAPSSCPGGVTNNASPI